MLQMLVAGPITSGSSGEGHVSAQTSTVGLYGGYSSRYAKLQEGLDSSISLEGKSRVEGILNEIQLLSDVEKLLLYLKLPTGVPKDEYLRCSPPSCLPASNKREQGEAMTWIKSHLEEHGDVCMPKAEVYEEYKQFCVQHELRPLCNADFGKVMKTVFPDINTRRLGQRGQSRYFYGGLRKKLEHAPPGLPELEIHSKSTEVDSSSTDTEVFKASCKLVCEWADKLLDNKFNGIQSVAEHLVSSMYVNTKSVAAFTLIAAMQETGNQNLKGTALFTSQTNNSMDKHKETNLLLQQKLHKNKVLQKQKEKLQTMREENEQKQDQVVSQTSDQKVGSSSQSRKSTTPCKGSKTPILPSLSPSPVVSQSPRKVQASDRHIVATSAECLTMGRNDSENISTQSNTGSTNQEHPTAYIQSVIKHTGAPVSQMLDPCSGTDNSVSASNKHSITSGDVNMCDISQESGIMNSQIFGTSVESGQDVIRTSNDKSVSSCSVSEKVASSRETPYTEMEVNLNSLSHVRKISFDDVGEQPMQSSGEQNIAKSVADLGKSAKMEILSKSAGHLSLKMLLERKDENQSGLNKSTGLLEKSKNNFLMNQSNVQGRSAFVPFAQVQQPRRDSGEASQSLPVSIPNTIPSISEKSISTNNESTVQGGAQSANITMIPLPNNETVHISNIHQQGQITQDNILKLFPSTATVQFPSHVGDKVSLAYTLSSSLNVSCSTNSTVLDTLTILTPSTSVTSSNTHVTVSSSQLSPGTSKHLRSRFTPIRPKGSPNKGASTRDTKSDNPVYDKRPVSEILKEKRAKEQAEALAKLQAGITMPTIPFQPSVPLNSGNFGNLQHLQAVSGKEVVIIVNNQVGGNMQNLANQTTVVTQPLYGTRQDKDAGKDSTRPSKHGETLSTQKSREEAKSFGQMRNDTKGTINGKENDGSVGSDNIETENSLSQFCDLQPASSSSEMETESDDMSIISESHVSDKGNGTIANAEQEQLEKFEQIYTETPAKIAKLNITSPFRPDSACSLGRETPLRITKPQEPSTSRPESACSFGRETPSGARKRKSSDYQHRKDFKRLNSTGDEGEDLVTDRSITELLSPGAEASVSDSHRRTQSCTFELDRDVRRSINFSSKTQTPNLPEGLQSPDISSLEEEALIESFPNSLFVMRPHKSQRHSIGVNARSVKVSQQKLLKQKQALDKQVGSFLEQNQSAAYGTNQTKSSSHDDSKVNSDFKVPFTSHAVVKDSVRDATNNSSMCSDVKDPFAQTGQVSGISCAQTSRIENEPSGLPSDVADWINETIEKRQTLNQSVLSEPELGVLNPQRASTAIDFVAPKFHFEVDHDVRAKSSLSACNPESRVSQKRHGSKGLNDGNFTIPKVPSLTLKMKDGPPRTGEAQNPSQRCQSLPMFTSTSKSPVSPICLQENKHPLYQRAVSMSPRQPGDGQNIGQSTLLSPVSGLTSPLRRIEVRDNHPISVSVHSAISASSFASLKSRDESCRKFTNFGNISKLNQGQLDEGRGQVGSYLASIQHNLQKPKDNMQDVDQVKSKEVCFAMPSTKFAVGSRTQTFPSLKSTPSTNPVVVSDNSVNLAQFSDSGYHSSGTSPVMNSTPVSGTQEAESVRYVQTSNGRVSESPISMSPSVHQSHHVAPKIQVTFPQTDGSLQSVSKSAQGIISSSKTSAFIPIQSSNQNMHFVTPTPIRPTVSLPSQFQVTSAVENFVNQPNLLIDSNQLDVDQDQDVQMVSPKAHDPPPYETAVKSLRLSNLNMKGAKTSLDVSGMNTNNGEHEMVYQNDGIYHNDSGAYSTERVSLLANMGKDLNSIDKDSFGPFASKLVQLSKQTKSSPSQQDLTPVKATNLPSSNQPFVTVTGHLTCDLALPPSDNRASADEAIAIHSNINERLDSENKERYVDMITDYMDSSNDIIAGNDSSIPQSMTELAADGQTSLFIPSRDGSNMDQKGAKNLLSQISEHGVSAVNINIGHFHQQKSQSILHLSSNSISNDRVLYSTNPSFPTLISNNQPSYKNISNSQLSSFIDIEKAANVTNAIPLSSDFSLNSDHNVLKDLSKPDDTLHAHGYVEMSPSESTRVILNDELTEFGESQNNESGINQRNDRIELPEDIDLMFQEWKDLL